MTSTSRHRNRLSGDDGGVRITPRPLSSVRYWGKIFLWGVLDNGFRPDLTYIHVWNESSAWRLRGLRETTHLWNLWSCCALRDIVYPMGLRRGKPPPLNCQIGPFRRNKRPLAANHEMHLT